MSSQDNERPSKDRQKSQIEPSPSDLEFFTWLEHLFDGPGNFPERLDVFAVSGRYKEQQRKKLDSVPFPPKQTKPERPELVSLCNRILATIQKDCDIQRKPTDYTVKAFHFTRDSDAYSQYPLPMKPKGIHREDRSGDDDPEFAEKYQTKWLQHVENMNAQNMELMGGMFDRLDRALMRSEEWNVKLQEKNIALTEQLERVLSGAEDREAKRKWEDVKADGARMGLNLVNNIAPMMLANLASKGQIQQVNGNGHIQPSIESRTLANLLKSPADGGSMTQEQGEVLFGVFDTSQNPPIQIKQGILHPEQMGLIVAIASCKAPADALDNLLPGHPLEISQEQLFGLQQTLTMEQLIPLQLLFSMRMKNNPGNQGNEGA